MLLSYTILDFWFNNGNDVLLLGFHRESEEWICLGSLASDRSSDEECRNVDSLSFRPRLYLVYRWHLSWPPSFMYEWCILRGVYELTFEVSKSRAKRVTKKSSIDWSIHFWGSLKNKDSLSDSCRESCDEFRSRKPRNLGWNIDSYHWFSTIIALVNDTRTHEWSFTPWTVYFFAPMVSLSPSLISSIIWHVKAYVLAIVSSHMKLSVSPSGRKCPLIVQEIGEKLDFAPVFTILSIVASDVKWLKSDTFIRINDAFLLWFLDISPWNTRSINRFTLHIGPIRVTCPSYLHGEVINCIL